MATKTLYDYLSERRSSWRRIAAQTHGEHETDDVLGTAWEVATLWKHGTFNTDSEDDWDQLCAIVYSKLINFTEKNLRYATRLDHATDPDSDRSCHSLAKTLASSDLNPLDILIQEEETDDTLQKLEKLGNSISAGFLLLQDRFNFSFTKIAHTLNISISWLYRCRIRAATIDKDQLSLLNCYKNPLLLEHINGWRRFKISVDKQINVINRTGQMKLNF